MDTQKTFVQKYLVLPKLCFFLLYMAINSYSGLGPAYFKENWGFDNSDVGYLMALQGVNFIGAIFWSSMADKTGKHKQLLVIGTLLWAFFVTVNAIPRMIQYEFSTLHSILFTSLFMVISNFCQASMFPLLDSAMISMLSQDPAFTKDQFGLQRLFGSPGHFLAAIIQGTTDYLPKPKNVWLYQAIIVFWSVAFSGMVMIALPSHTKQIPKSFTHHGHKDQGKPNHLSQATALPLAPSPIVPAAPDVDVEPIKKKESSPVVQLLTNPGFLFFLLFVISAGFLANSLTIYQSIMVAEFYAKHGKKKQEDKNRLLMTATTKFPSTVSEITIFFFSRPLMRTFGVYWLLLASQFFGILRMMAYVYMPPDAPKWFPHAIEVLKGLNSGLIVSAAVRIASDIAPPGCSNSAQGLFSGVYKGLSVTFTGVVGGLLLQFAIGQDIQQLFYWVAMFAVFTTVCFFFKFLLIDKTIGFSCGGGAKQTPAMAHETASTSSFGSIASSTDVQSTAPMKVGGDKKLAV